jgi:septal ring factor EnvC (AmiA/AmiB activator)
MEIHHLRSWVEFADKVTIIALAVAGIAIIAAGATSWLSFKYNKALQARDNTALSRATDYTAKLEKEVASLVERSSQLEKAFAEADGRVATDRIQIARLESAVEAAMARAADLEKEVAAAKASNEKRVVSRVVV